MQMASYCHQFDPACLQKRCTTMALQCHAPRSIWSMTMMHSARSLLTRVEFSLPETADEPARDHIMAANGSSMLTRVEFATPGSAGNKRWSLAHPLLFLKAWAAHPLRMGSVFPSSRALCQRIVREAWPMPGKCVLILGAGTGVVPQAFLEARLAPERLVLLEID